MALSSLSGAKTQLEANLDWFGPPVSAAKAKLAHEAIKWILTFRPKDTSRSATSSSFSDEHLRDELKRIENVAPLHTSANVAPFVRARAQ